MGTICSGLIKRGEVKVQGLIQGIVVGLVLTGSVWSQAVPPVQPPASADAQSTSGTPATSATTPAPAATPSAASEVSGGTISGTVKAGAVPLPGVAVTASNTLTGKKYATTTDVNGAFAMTVPRNGRYVGQAARE